MPTPNPSQPETATAHTPRFIPSDYVVEAIPHYNDNGKIVNYEVAVYDLGGGDCFTTHGMTAEDAERQARNIIRSFQAPLPSSERDAFVAVQQQQAQANESMRHARDTLLAERDRLRESNAELIAICEDMRDAYIRRETKPSEWRPIFAQYSAALAKAKAAQGGAK